MPGSPSRSRDGEPRSMVEGVGQYVSFALQKLVAVYAPSTTPLGGVVPLPRFRGAG